MNTEFINLGISYQPIYNEEYNMGSFDVYLGSNRIFSSESFVAGGIHDVKTYAFNIVSKIDLDEWEYYGYESKEQMRNVSLDEDGAAEDYWDLVNNFSGMPIIKVELINEE